MVTLSRVIERNFHTFVGSQLWSDQCSLSDPFTSADYWLIGINRGLMTALINRLDLIAKYGGPKGAEVVFRFLEDAPGFAIRAILQHDAVVGRTREGGLGGLAQLARSTEFRTGVLLAFSYTANSFHTAETLDSFLGLLRRREESTVLFLCCCYKRVDLISNELIWSVGVVGSVPNYCRLLYFAVTRECVTVEQLPQWLGITDACKKAMKPAIFHPLQSKFQEGLVRTTYLLCMCACVLNNDFKLFEAFSQHRKVVGIEDSHENARLNAAFLIKFIKHHYTCGNKLGGTGYRYVEIVKSWRPSVKCLGIIAAYCPTPTEMSQLFYPSGIPANQSQVSDQSLLPFLMHPCCQLMNFGHAIDNYDLHNTDFYLFAFLCHYPGCVEGFPSEEDRNHHHEWHKSGELMQRGDEEDDMFGMVGEMWINGPSKLDLSKLMAQD